MHLFVLHAEARLGAVRVYMYPAISRCPCMLRAVNCDALRPAGAHTTRFRGYVGVSPTMGPRRVFGRMGGQLTTRCLVLCHPTHKKYNPRNPSAWWWCHAHPQWHGHAHLRVSRLHSKAAQFVCFVATHSTAQDRNVPATVQPQV